MNPKIKAQYIEALRGHYTQTYGVLMARQPDGSFCYCALGVLCDVISPDGWEDTGLVMYEGTGMIYQTLNCCTTVLPTELRLHAGLSVEEESYLLDLNDHEKLTFAQIADCVESNL